MTDYQFWNIMLKLLALLVSIGGFLIALFKLNQYLSEKREHFENEIKWKTEKAYEHYKLSSVLNAAAKTIFDDSKGATDYSDFKTCNYEIVIIINYLESMAIGIEQNLYNEKQMKDYLEGAVYKATKVFLLGESGNYRGRSWKANNSLIDPKESPHLMKLYRTWNSGEITTEFKNVP